MQFKTVVLGISCAAALCAGYAGVVYWQAGHLTVQTEQALEKDVFKSHNPHRMLVLVVAAHRYSGTWPAVTGLASGYSGAMFQAQEQVPASRTEHSRGVSCVEEGKPPTLTVTAIKGAYKPLEYYGGSFAGFDETEADFDTFSRKLSDATSYVSGDGGRTGVTTSRDGNAGWRWLMPAIHAPRAAYPSLEPDCHRFDESAGKKDALIAQIIGAINLHQTWRWTDTTGKAWEWTPSKSPSGKNTGLTLSGSPDTLEKVRQELVAEMTRTGVPPWFGVKIVRTREDWSPHTRELTLTTFETQQGHSLVIIARKPDTNKAELDVFLSTGRF